MFSFLSSSADLQTRLNTLIETLGNQIEKKAAKQLKKLFQHTTPQLMNIPMHLKEVLEITLKEATIKSKINFAELNEEQKLALAKAYIRLLNRLNLLTKDKQSVRKTVLSFLYANAVLKKESKTASLINHGVNKPILNHQQYDQKTESFIKAKKLELKLQQEREGIIEQEMIDLRSGTRDTYTQNDEDKEIKASNTKEVSAPTTNNHENVADQDKQHIINDGTSQILNYLFETMLFGLDEKGKLINDVIDEIFSSPHMQDEELLASQKHYITALKPEDWISVLNDFFTALKIDEHDSGYIFARLNEFNYLPAHVYLVELLSHLDLLKDINSQKANTIIKAFFQANEKKYTDIAWQEELFSLLNLKCNESVYSQDLYWAWVEKIVAISAITNETTNEITSITPFTMLAKSIKMAIYNYIDADEQLDYHHLISLLEIAVRLMQDYGQNPFVIRDGMFIIEMINIWKSCAEQPESTANIPLFPCQKIEKGDTLAFYEVATDAQERIDAIAYYSIFEELLPHIQDQQAFKEVCQRLYDDLSLDVIEDIRKCLVNNYGFVKLDGDNQAIFAEFKSSVGRRIRSLQLQQSNPGFLELLEAYFNKNIIVYQKTFKTEDKIMRMTKVTQTNNKLDQSMMLLKSYDSKQDGDTKYHYIMPATTVFSYQLGQTIDKNRHTQKVFLLRLEINIGLLLQNIWNTAKFYTQDRIHNLSGLTDHLISMQYHTRRKLMRTLLDGKTTDIQPSLHFLNATEVKEDEAVRLQTNKVSTLIRSIAVDPELKQPDDKKFESSVATMPELASYQDLDYMQLLKCGVTVEFYESFMRPLTKRCIMNCINTENFLELYNHWIQCKALESNPEDNIAEYSLINLIKIPVDTDAVITEEVVRYLAYIQQNIDGTRHPGVLKETYKILKNILNNRDAGKLDHATFIQLLKMLHNFIMHLNPLYVEAEVKSQLVHELNIQELTLSILQEAIKKVKLAYPLEDDILEEFDSALEANDSQQVIAFIERCQSKNKLWLVTSNSQVQFMMRFDKLLMKMNGFSLEQANKILSIIKSDTNTQDGLESTRIGALIQSLLTDTYYLTATAMLTVFGIAKSNTKIFTDYLHTIAANPAYMSEKPGCQELFIWIASQDYSESNESPPANAISTWLNNFIEVSESKTVDDDQKLVINDNYRAVIRDLRNEYFNIIALRMINDSSYYLLPLLVELNANWMRKSGANQAIWYNNDGTIKAEFSSAICASLNIPYEALLPDLLKSPQFLFRSYIVDELATHCRDLTQQAFLRIALIALQSKAILSFDTAKEFALRVKSLFDKQQEWNKRDLLLNIDDKLYAALLLKSNELKLDQINALITTITGYTIPPSFKLHEHLDRILQLPETQWLQEINELPQTMLTFTIAAYPVAKVKELFEQCQPSLDELLIKTIVFKSMSQTPLDYLFYVYDGFNGIKEMIADHRKKTATETDKNKIIKDLTASLHENKPAPRREAKLEVEDRQRDVAFFGALALLSFYTTEQEPFHAQMITVMGAIYGLNGFDKLLSGVATGQGKTLMLRLVAIALLIIHDPSYIAIYTLTVNDAKKNLADGIKLFNALDIPATTYDRQEDIHPKGKIRYLTAGHDMELLDDEYIDHVFTTYTKPIEDAKPILLVDEADVIYNDRKGQTRSWTSYTIPHSYHFLKTIWDTKITDVTQAKNELLNSNEFKKLDSDAQAYFTNNFDSFFKNAWAATNEKINTVTAVGELSFESATGIVSNQSVIGFGMTYFRKLKAGHGAVNYKLGSTRISYQNVLDQYSIILGMSGTTDIEEGSYYQHGYQYFDTPNYNASKLTSLNPIVCPDDKWLQTMSDKTKHYSDNGQPVLTVVEHPDNVKTIVDDPYFKQQQFQKLNTFIGDETIKQYQSIIDTATQRDINTGKAAVTVGSIISGRGANYQPTDPNVEDAGGMVVINGYIQETDRLEKQVAGRTARGEHNGIYLPMYTESAVRTFLKSGDIVEDEINAVIQASQVDEKETTGIDANDHPNLKQLIAKARKNISDKKQLQSESKDTDLLEEFTKHFYKTVMTQPGLLSMHKGYLRQKFTYNLFQPMLRLSSAELANQSDSLIDKYNDLIHCQDEKMSTPVKSTFKK